MDDGSKWSNAGESAWLLLPSFSSLVSLGPLGPLGSILHQLCFSDTPAKAGRKSLSPSCSAKAWVHKLNCVSHAFWAHGLGVSWRYQENTAHGLRQMARCFSTTSFIFCWTTSANDWIKADTNKGTAMKTTQLFTNCLGQAICCIFDLKVDSLCQAYGVPYTIRRQSSGSNDGFARVDQVWMLHDHTKANTASKPSSSTSSTCTGRVIIPESHGLSSVLQCCLYLW